MTAVILSLLVAAVGLSLLMMVAWWVQKRSGRSGWVDVTWTYGLGLAGVLVALWPADGAPSGRQWLVAALVAAWSARLGTHVAQRTARGGDDPRYARLKQDWGARAQARMFGFLQVQALAAWLLAAGVMAAAHAPRPGLDAQDGLGVLILLVAVAGEALADSQVKRFSADPANKGRVCDAGLWRVSRHPNYFFECLGWVAYPVIALAAGYPWGWAAVLCPVYMTYLLVYVSGIPPLEEHMMRTRRDAFAAYKARTSAFFPLPPKKDGSSPR